MEEFELEPGERVIKAVRKHWLVFLFETLPFILLALLPVLIEPLLSLLPQGYVSTGAFDLSEPWTRLLLGSWWLFMWTGFFNAFTKFYLDVWVITTARIVNIHQHRFFDREVSSFLLARVQDVTTEVDGIFQTLIGFGTLRVETAGDSSKDFEIKGVPNPERLRDLIMREIAELHKADAVSI